MAVGRERETQLRDSWNAETEDTASATWREGLTREEARLVGTWDRAFHRGMLRLCEDILAEARHRERLALAHGRGEARA